MKILAIDPGTHSGWAYWDGQHLESGVQVFDLKRGESPGMRFLMFRSWLYKFPQPDLYIYEQAHHRGGAATELLLGMTTRIQEQAAEVGRDYVSIHSATLKKWSTGSGRASKQDMIDAAEDRRGLDVHDDNEADAILLCLWARDEYEEKPK